MKVLVTAGGTEEPVDGVRRLCNTSTGATGAVLARRFSELGAEVVLLHAARARVEAVEVERASFVTFAELEAALRRLLGERDWDAVVHLAAVADYTVTSIEIDGRPQPRGRRGKIGSGHDVVLRLAPTRKLIDSLRTWSRNPAITVVGFKLTDDPDPTERESQIRRLLDRGSADLVVHNDLSEITDANHRAEIWQGSGRLARTDTKEELADQLFRLLATGAGGADAKGGRAPTEELKR